MQFKIRRTNGGFFLSKKCNFAILDQNSEIL